MPGGRTLPRGAGADLRRRTLLAVGMAVLLSVAGASPAGAHAGPGGEDAISTNYRTRITGVSLRWTG